MIRWKLKDLTEKIFKEQDGKFEVGLNFPMLIGIMITIIVGISLIGPITSVTSSITSATTTTIAKGTTTTTPAYSSAVQGIAGVLPIIMVAVIILGAVGWIGFRGFGNSEDKEEKKEKSITVTIKTNSQRVISLVMKASNELEPYINNLDELLRIKTVVQGLDGLSLIGNNLYIPKGTEQGGEYDWYITAKQKDADVFKVVGLNKTDASKNVVYVLGNNGTPFLFKVVTNKIESEINHPILVEHWTTK